MTRQRPGFLVALGLLLGIGLSIGALYGARALVPNFRARAADFFAIMAAEGARDPDAPANVIDSGFVKGIVQDILTSDQGKAIVSEMVSSQSDDTLRALFKKTLETAEARKALKDALYDFLTSEDGKSLVNQIIQEYWETP